MSTELLSFKKHFRFWLYFHIWISSYLLISDLSRTISRVMSKLQQATVGMIIYLGRLLPAASSNLPKAGGPRQRFCSVLLRMGFTYAPSVTREAVVSYTALPPLPGIYRAVYFCCTILRVASTGRYPASCPVKPGLSSPARMQPRSSVLLIIFSCFCFRLLSGKLLS